MSITEQLDSYLFYRYLDDAINGLKSAHPSVKIVALPVDGFYLPAGVVACDGEGEGECDLKKRVGYHKLITNAEDDVIIEIHLHEYWTSSFSTPDTDNGLLFWNEEEDKEVYVKVPVAEGL